MILDRTGWSGSIGGGMGMTVRSDAGPGSEGGGGVEAGVDGVGE